jgi:hypothetical protein
MSKNPHWIGASIGAGAASIGSGGGNDNRVSAGSAHPRRKSGCKTFDSKNTIFKRIPRVLQEKCKGA